METLTKVMIQVVAGEVFGTKLDDSIKESLTDEFLLDLYNLSHKHDIAHLVGYALDKQNLLPVSTVSDKFREQFFTSIFRYERLEFDYLNICNELEKSQTEFMPLKGSVLKSRYPEPWMRTSSDIDILIHSEDLDKIKRFFETELQYVVVSSSRHDITFKTPNNNLVELHFDLIEESRAKNSTKVLQKVWEFSQKRAGSEFLYEMNDEMFLLYHIAHIAKHFESGGCGVRAFLDLGLLLHQSDFWNLKTEELLKKAELLVFANAVRDLCNVWFFGKEHNSTTLKMQEYIISGGTFGTKSNAFAVKQSRGKGKFKYILSRIFLPYDELKLQYPIIEKFSFLSPLCEICRWFKLIFGKKSINSKKNINIVKNTSENDVSHISDLFNTIGL